MKRTWRIHLLVLLGYVLLSIIVTWPLAPHFTTALPGEGSDSWQYLWNFWWFDQALFHGRPLYFTQAQYYPQGTSLLFHTLSPLNSLAGLPARLLGGYPAAYNLVVLLASVLSGYGVFLLVMEVLGKEQTFPATEPAEAQVPAAVPGKAGFLSRITPRVSAFLSPGPACSPPWAPPAAFLAGAIFALCPYRSVHLLGHLSLVSTETLPFFALFCFRAIRRPGWKPALGITLSWLAAALIDWYYPFYMVLLAGFFLAWTLGETLLRRPAGRAPAERWRHFARAAGTIAAGLLAAALVLSPLLVPMLRESGRAAYLEEPLEFSTTYGADLAAFFLPSPLHPLWDSTFSRWTEPLADGNTAEGIVYLGFVALALAAVGLWRERRAGKVWAILAGLSGLLALGPYLKILNVRTGVPLPYLLLAQLPIARFTRVPSRYAILVELALAVLAGLGAAALLAGRRPEISPQRRAPRRAIGGGALFVLLLILIVCEFLPVPYRVTPAQIPPYYQELAQDPGDYALLELPLQRPQSQWYYTRWMLYQTVHGKDSFRGYISRGDPLFPFAGAPLFRQLAQLGPADDITYDDFHPLAQAVLSYYRVGAIVLERKRLEDQGRFGRAQALVEEVLGPTGPVYEDEELVAYRVKWGPVVPFLRLGAGWHEVEQQEWGPFRWMERDRSELYVVLPEEREVTLTFQAVSFRRPRHLTVLLDEKAVAELDIGTALQPYRFAVRLPAGETRLELRADGYDVPKEVGAGEDTRAVSIGFSQVRVR